MSLDTTLLQYPLYYRNLSKAQALRDLDYYAPRIVRAAARFASASFSEKEACVFAFGKPQKKLPAAQDPVHTPAMTWSAFTINYLHVGRPQTARASFNRSCEWYLSCTHEPRLQSG